MTWKDDLHLSDLEPDCKIEIICRRCGKLRYETAAGLRDKARLAQATCAEAERALRCHDRFCDGPVRVALTHQGRTEGFTGGLA